jgi:hypothetical protein
MEQQQLLHQPGPSSKGVADLLLWQMERGQRGSQLQRDGAYHVRPPALYPFGPVIADR